jgi:ectoine hydroxylase-related dioxygenase (phytanoyl-CoA dioxygenase family)
MLHAAMVDMVADLIGPDVKFHHCKINLKLPGTDTEVGFHQDFAYTPHTNDDLVTALVMLDDMTLDNGCLRVIPGSHKGSTHSHYEKNQFRGFISPEAMREMEAEEVPITGTAGSVCLMHTRLVHGSRPNRSERPRGLYIAVYSAADAVPLAVSPLPNPNEGRIVRGKPSRFVRLRSVRSSFHRESGRSRSSSRKAKSRRDAAWEHLRNCRYYGETAILR